MHLFCVMKRWKSPKQIFYATFYLGLKIGGKSSVKLIMLRLNHRTGGTGEWPTRKWTLPLNNHCGKQPPVSTISSTSFFYELFAWMLFPIKGLFWKVVLGFSHQILCLMNNRSQCSSTKWGFSRFNQFCLNLKSRHNLELFLNAGHYASFETKDSLRLVTQKARQASLSCRSSPQHEYFKHSEACAAKNVPIACFWKLFHGSCISHKLLASISFQKTCEENNFLTIFIKVTR